MNVSSISAVKLSQAQSQASVKVQKAADDVKEKVVMTLIQGIDSVSPQKGQNINITA